MIIDVILDRQEGAIDYAPETHLRAIYDYATDAGMTDIATAVDSGKEADVKAALMRYITACGYPSALLDYIASVRWTDDATAVAAEKLAIIRKVATRLRRKIKHERLAIVHDSRLTIFSGEPETAHGNILLSSPFKNQALMIVSYNLKNSLTRYENLIN